MLFNSLEFAVFLPTVFVLYWFIFQRSLTMQNGLLLLVSYVFYGWWDWRFLSLIAVSSLVDFLVGLRLDRSTRRTERKALLGVSLAANLGMLGCFKYYDFFAQSLIDGLAQMGLTASPMTLNLILPVGISFYTFQTLSYTIDVYRGRVQATRDPVAFFAFVSFFPQLVAGPIERAGNLLPQFYGVRSFSLEQASSGMRQILWGLFKKLVIADACGIRVDLIFANYESLSGASLLLGAMLFAFQIYGDFSGYSDIAIGTAKLFGFQLMTNFRTPYFSRDIAEFWRRWHISLSTWFRDYVYVPLGGSRGSTSLQVRNLFIIFLVSGLWHGANWTFLAWGAINALYFLPLLISRRNRANLDDVAQGKLLPTFSELGQMSSTFMLILFAWIFFRAPDLTTAWDYCRRTLDLRHFVPQYVETSVFANEGLVSLLVLLLLIGLMMTIEWINRDREFGLDVRHWSSRPRHALYQSLAMLIVFMGVFGRTEFIYFQF